MACASSDYRVRAVAREAARRDVLQRPARQPVHELADRFRLLDPRSRDHQPLQAGRDLRRRLGLDEHPAESDGDGTLS